MANLSENYDKAALILSLVVALALGAMVLMAKGRVEEDFAEPAGGTGNSIPTNENEELFKSSTDVVGADVELKGPVTEKGRPINNFVGTPLFLKQGESKAVDLGDATYPAVHDPIPNEWWLTHRIDPGWSDSPQRDPDGDGFTNLDEFTGNTNPNDPNDFPDLYAKLKCVRMEKRVFKLIYSSDSSIGALQAKDTFMFKHEEVVNNRKISTSSESIQPGKGADSNLFSKGGAQLRYEFKEIQQRTEKNPRNGILETSNFALLEDVGSAKKGDKVELKKGSRNGVIIRDWTAVLVLAAVGQESNELKVQERDSFALPFDPNAAKKPFTFTGVTDDGAAIIEWEHDGETKTLELAPAN